MPPSVGEFAEGVGVLFDGALEGVGDGGVAEAGDFVGGDGAGFAFAAVAGFFGGAAAFLGDGAAFFGAGLVFFDDDFGGFAAFFTGFFAGFAALDGFAACFAAGFLFP